MLRRCSAGQSGTSLETEDGKSGVERQGEDTSRVIQRMDAALRLAELRFAEGASAEESIGATMEALGQAVDVPAEVFVRMSPQSMVGLLEMTGSDERVLSKVAEALMLQSEVFMAEGSLIEAGARR